MKTPFCRELLLGVALAIAGCAAEVETTDDSERVSVEVPKVETGDQPVDLDPGTDEDIDVDTPLPGDR
jgi:hypothetical protein